MHKGKHLSPGTPVPPAGSERRAACAAAEPSLIALAFQLLYRCRQWPRCAQALPAPTQGPGSSLCHRHGLRHTGTPHCWPPTTMTSQQSSSNLCSAAPGTALQLTPKCREADSTERFQSFQGEYFTVSSTGYVIGPQSKALHDLRLTSSGFSLMLKSSRYFTRLLLNSCCLQPHN